MRDLTEKKLDGSIAYKGSFLTLHRDKVLCPNGRETYREVLRHPGASAVIVKIDDKYLLERQFRYPVGEDILEIPAGKKDAGEEFLATAIRELEEECGYKAADMTYLGTIYSTVGFTDEQIAIYYTENPLKTSQHLDEDEEVELLFYTLEEIKDMIVKGIIKDAKTIAGFGLLMMR